MMEPSESDLVDESLDTREETTRLVVVPKTTTNTISPMVLGVEENGSTAIDGLPRSRPLAFLKSMVQECLCETFAPGERAVPGVVPVEQFVQIHGIEFIGLGALTDELSAKERVYDTLEQLTSRTERLISIGYLTDDDKVPGRKKTDTIPLDIWSQSYPDDRTMSRPIRRAIASIKTGNFEQAFRDFRKAYDVQKRRPLKNNNFFMLGISAHNLGVISVLAGRDYEALVLFEEAVDIKRQAFGKDHPEIAVSLDEIGIQFFAKERYGEALVAFFESLDIICNSFGPSHPRMCMLKNNIACCNFVMGMGEQASMGMKQALEIQQQKNNSNPSAKNDLDLLHMVIVLNNSGYVKANAKQYEEAMADFEEALLIQQSIFGDSSDHRAIRDSRSNLDFSNAFHS